MPLVTGLLGQRSAHLLATLLVVHSLKLANAVSLSVDAPRFLVGGVAVTESAKYPLLAIVRCSDGHLDMNVSEIFVLADSGPLHIQIEENSNNPNEFFILPNHTGAALEDGEYQIEITCHSQSTVSQVAGILVSILTPAFAAENDQPYFTAAPRYVNISSNTSPGTVIATYDAKFQAGSGQQPTTQQYAVHKDFLGTPFQLDSSSGELSVSESLQKEGTLSMYDIVIVADQGQNEAWTVTTIVIEPLRGNEQPRPSSGSGTRGQVNKIIPTAIAILLVWARYILP